MSSRVIKLIIQVFLLSCVVIQARAELVIEITQGKQTAIPMAVVPF
jgi:hypothetical protein